MGVTGRSSKVDKVCASTRVVKSIDKTHGRDSEVALCKGPKSTKPKDSAINPFEPKEEVLVSNVHDYCSRLFLSKPVVFGFLLLDF